MTVSEPFARAMGPMQFIPETWRLYGVDANNDRVGQRGQHRRRGAVGGGIPVLARKRPVHAAGLDGGPACVQPLRAVRPDGARLGDGLRRRTCALSTPAAGPRSRLKAESVFEPA